MDPLRIDEIARRLLESVPAGLRTMQKDLESNFRAVLRASLTKLDLVSRDEFDAQKRVLERTRARLENLERRVAALDGIAQADEVAGGSLRAAADQPGAAGAAPEPSSTAPPDADPSRESH